uniref:ZP domain-containing protein n=1 Tax=Romanomermis culicivorax TaxID=13658 RepID=A0A915IEB1_ROMCU
MAVQVVVRTAAQNSLLRERTVSCNSEEMKISLQFSQPFSGVVYANKFYDKSACRYMGDGSRRMDMEIPLNSNPLVSPFCGVQLKEKTGEYTVHLTMSPMKSLIVEGMETLTIRCLYLVSDVTLTLPVGSNGPGLLINSKARSDVVTGSGGNPFLQMVIRDGHGVHGDVVQSAHVGQKITLDVLMRDTCATKLPRAVDIPAYTTIPIPNGAKHFTTSQLVHFQCQIRPCLQTCNRAQCSNPDLLEDSRLITLNNTQTRIERFKRGLHLKQNSTSNLKLVDPYDDSDNYNLSATIRIDRPSEKFSALPRQDEDSAAATFCFITLFLSVYMCFRANSDQSLIGDNLSNNCSDMERRIVILKRDTFEKRSPKPYCHLEDFCAIVQSTARSRNNLKLKVVPKN